MPAGLLEGLLAKQANHCHLVEPEHHLVDSLGSAVVPALHVGPTHSGPAQKSQMGAILEFESVEGWDLHLEAQPPASHVGQLRIELSRSPPQN